MAHHILGDSHGIVQLAIVDFKGQPDEAGQNGGAARLRADGNGLFAFLGGTGERKAVGVLSLVGWSALMEIAFALERMVLTRRCWALLCAN